MTRNRFASQSAILLGLCTATAVAVAADAQQSAAAKDTENLEEVVVTGSRLQAAGFNAPTPVTVVTAETVEQRAPANLSEVLLEQPAFRITGGDASRNGSGGNSSNPLPQGLISTPDLRSLGSTRTLVLINNHSSVFTSWGGAVDINIVPVGLVERIDVVTGGASAQYGSDAVAGVTNVILRSRMEGVKLGAQMGLTDYRSGKQFTFNLSGGHTFLDGRLHVIAGLDANRTNPINDVSGKQFARDEIGNFAGANNALTAYRVVNNAQATVITNNVEPASIAVGGLAVATNGTAYTFDPFGNPVAFSRGTVSQNGQLMIGSTSNLGHNLNNQVALRLEQGRYDFMTRASFDVTDNMDAYVEIGNSRNIVFPYLASDFSQSGSIGGATPGIVIGPTNQFRTAAINAALGTAAFTMGRINTELSFQGISGSAARQDSETQRYVFGIEGGFGQGWKYDAYYQTGRTYTNLTRDDYSAVALQKAVNGCATPILGSPGFATAQLVTLAARYDSLSGKICAPLNPFGQGAPSQAAINYIQNATYSRQHLWLDVGAFSLSGSIFKLPAGDVAIATGVEWRQERLAAQVDPVSRVGNAVEGGVLTNSIVESIGSNSVREGFVEVGVPLFKDKPLLRSMDFNAAARVTKYESSGTVRTWKVGMTWDPSNVLRARITKSHDIRAASLMQMFFFGGPNNGNVDTTGLLVGTVGAGGTVYNPLGNTAAVGKVASNAGTQVTILNTGGVGNPFVNPEVADTVTGGLIFRMGGLNASVDYYYVNLTGAIGGPASQTVINNCIAGDTRYCQELTFNPGLASGIQLLSAPNENLNRQVVKGMDFEVGYRKRLGPGDFQVRALVNYQPHNESINVTTGQTTDQANTLASQPKIGYNLSFGYDVGRWTTDLQIRGFGERRGNNIIYNSDGSIASTTVLGPEDGAAYAARVASAAAVVVSGVTVAQAGTVAASTSTINKNRWPAQFFVNPSVSYKLNDKVTAFLNVDNLFDKQPPGLALNASAYDFIGRSFRFGVRGNF